jgi:hypothetical protein
LVRGEKEKKVGKKESVVYKWFDRDLEMQNVCYVDLG